MINRFFKESDNIEALTDKQLDDFLREEKVVGKIERTRVQDFYNNLSRAATGEEIAFTNHTDYDYFGAKTDEDYAKIDQMKNMEHSFLNSIDKDILTQQRLLKASLFLAKEFEEMFNNGNKSRPPSEDINEKLKNLFDFDDDTQLEHIPFGELMEMDFLFLRYIALLSKKKAFLKRQGKLVKAPGGKIHKYTPMDDFQEIYNMDLIQMVLPNFKLKLAQKDIYVRSKFDKVERGQNLMIIVDDSGSMNEDDKRAMVQAALTLKFRDASENNTIYISMFETEIKGFVKIVKGMTFKDIENMIRLGGGGTDVNGCIKSVINQIGARKLKKKGGGTLELSDDTFEILVLNDGQDHVDETFHPAIKTHALCLKQTNPRLRNICHRSGGTYFYMEGQHR